MTRRRHSARGLTVAQTSFYDASDDVEPSKKLVPDRQTRHGAAGVGANFELRAVKEVQEIFRGIVDDEIILSVLESCNYDSEKATSLLCEVTAAKPSAGPEHRSVDQQDRSSQSKILEKYTGPCLWDFLPMECKLQVWENLSLKDMARAAGTCKDFAMQAKETRSDLRTLKLPPGLQPDAVRGMVQAFGRATKIKLHGAYLTGPSAAAAIAAGSRARGRQGLPVDALDMSQCRRATELHAQQFFDAIPTLQELDMSNCSGLTDEALETLASSITALRAQEVPETQPQGAETAQLGDLSISDAFGNLRAGNTSRIYIQDGFESARESYNTSAGMQALLLDDYPKRRLSCLSLAGCCQITGKGLQALSKACSKSMRQLNISRTMVSSLQLLTKWSMLESLTANQCVGLTSVALQLPKTLPLKELSVSGCPDLGKLVICSASVLSVNVSSNSSLSHLSLSCAALTSLMASQCYRLEQLQEGFSCPNLKLANFAGCKALQGLPEIEAGCPELRSINLNGCMTLFRLALEQQPHLDRVEASGCKALRNVISNSSVLSSCYLQACPRLASLRLRSASLKHLDISNCSSLRELQLRMLERPIGELEAARASSKERHYLAVGGCSALPLDTLTRLQAALLRRRAAR